MTTLGSSSGVESSMDELSDLRRHRQTSSKKPRRRPSTTTTTEATVSTTTTGKSDDKYEEAEGGGDPRVWTTFNHSFRQVQSVLDRNRLLIQQVNENHRSRIPDNMVKNVALIQELNGNISKVVSLYSDLSSDFSTAFHKRTNNDSGRHQDSPDS